MVLNYFWRKLKSLNVVLIDYWNCVLGEKNARSKEMIRQKAGEYMERAEKLKNHLADEEKKKKPRAMGANGKESGGGGKKYV